MALNKLMTPTPPKGKIALVVDDEKVIATTLAVMLNNAGCDDHALFWWARCR